MEEGLVSPYRLVTTRITPAWASLVFFGFDIFKLVMLTHANLRQFKSVRPLFAVEQRIEGRRSIIR